MTDDVIDDDRLTRFLLGDVSDAERTAIEERFLADEELFQRMLLLEDELRDAYATGTLSSADRQRFDQRFLIFDDERATVATRRALAAEMAAVGSSGAVASRPAAPETGGRLGSLWAAFQSLAMPWRLSMAGASALVIATLAWQVAEGVRLRSELSRLAREASAREQAIAGQASGERARAEQLAREVEEERRTRALLEQELARRPDAPRAGGTGPRMVLSLLLTPGRTRAGGESRALTVPPAATEVHLQLEVADTGVRRYEAVILDADGEEVWRRGDLPAGGRLVTLAVPARLLSEGDFEISLTAVVASGDRDRSGEYYFRVLRP